MLADGVIDFASGVELHGICKASLECTQPCEWWDSGTLCLAQALEGPCGREVNTEHESIYMYLIPINIWIQGTAPH